MVIYLLYYLEEGVFSKLIVFIQVVHAENGNILLRPTPSLPNGIQSLAGKINYLTLLFMCEINVFKIII